MRLGVFGGSFNPPHLAHLIVADFFREELKLDRVLWIPARNPPHKQSEQILSAEHRVEMTRLAVSGNSAFEVSDVELRRGGVSFTLETLLQLGRDLEKEDELFLLVGSDSYEDFETWHQPDAIVSLASLVVYPRGAREVEVHPRFPATVVDAPVVDISGTIIRERCRQGRSIRYLVSERVRDYIESHGLYAGEVTDDI